MKKPKKAARARKPAASFLMQTVTVNLRDGSAVAWSNGADGTLFMFSAGDRSLCIKPTRAERLRLAELFAERGNYNPAKVPADENFGGIDRTVAPPAAPEYCANVRQEASPSYPPGATNNGRWQPDYKFAIAQQMARADIRPGGSADHPSDINVIGEVPPPSLDEMEAVMRNPSGILAAERAAEPPKYKGHGEPYFTLAEVTQAWGLMIAHRDERRRDEHIEWGRFLAALPEKSRW